MSAKHTPGPWHFTDDYNTHVIRSQPKEGREYGELLASIWGGRHEANARLIAASPDLYDALQAMLTHMGMDEDEWNRPTFKQARAAIAKATGAT